MSSVALQLILTQLGFPHNHSVSNLVKTLILKKVKIFLHLHVLDIPHLTHLLYMYPLAKFDGYRSCGNGNYFDYQLLHEHLRKAELTPSIRHI